MTRALPCRSQGFTLLEMLFVTALLVVSVSAATVSYVYVLRAERTHSVQNELDIDVRKTIESLRRDLRLSSVEEFVFYPEGAGPYTAISFPMGRDDDGDGLVELDADGRIIWDTTVVYHVWTSAPEQLRITTFDPRDNSLTPAQRQAQLNSVVATGNGSAAANGAHATTRVLFENLVDWTIRATGAIFDGYSATPGLTSSKELGTAVLTDGYHQFKFNVIGKNPNSTGYKVGIDTLTVSPSFSPREAEAQLPALASSGTTPVRLYKPNGSWSGNYILSFPATAVGHSFTLSMENDRWEETNFLATAAKFEDTKVVFDMSGSPYDFTVQLKGMGYAWSLASQTGDSTGVAPDASSLSGAAVRVLVRGSRMADGGWIDFNGQNAWVMFRGGGDSSRKLKVYNAFIAEAVDPDNPATAMNYKVGTAKAITFGGSSTGTFTYQQWSDMINLYVEKDKSYLVSFLVSSPAEVLGYAWKWTAAPTASGVKSCYLIPVAAAPGEAALLDPNWSARADVVGSDAAYGVEFLYAAYPTNGVFTSQIFDTHQTAPAYRTVGWNIANTSGSAVTMKLRTGDQPDLSDAAAFSNLTAVAAGTVSPGARRYAQFQAKLQSGNSSFSTPNVKDVTLRWAGQTLATDIGGTFATGPDYGMFELWVDNEQLVQGVTVDLTIFKDVGVSAGAFKRITSSIKTEIVPRNTGR